MGTRFSLIGILLIHLYHQILARRPECLRVGDTEYILLVGITLQGVGTRRMGCQNLSRLAIKFDLLVDTDINLGEILLVEVRTEHLTV